MTALRVVSQCRGFWGSSRANNSARSAFLLFLLIFSLPVLSATFDEGDGDISSFDHLTTGFPLEGVHSTIDCESCHIGGVFEELPKQCDACHDGVFATGVSTNHIPVTASCDVCHTTFGFEASASATGSGGIDHSILGGQRCDSCHDNVTATGKSPDHIPTTSDCGVCHTVNFWVPTFTIDHAGFADNSCITCHDGVTASGKEADHIASTDNCNACHNRFPDTWAPVAPGRVDHSQVIGSCVSCHDGITAEGKDSDHIESTDNCLACHQP
ncbi:MAG: cytochrome c3 family protein, partial [Gammaproteobacteria bacterium]